MKKTILSILMMLFCAWGYAQEVPELPEIFPESPTASELGKFGSYPVNLSTGLPQIEFPLYTIHSGDITIPITLKYHASGIKVNQTSSWVGLGWSLDTGGLINLETRDTPDELAAVDLYTIPDVDYLQDVIDQNPYKFAHPDIVNAVNNSWVKDAYHINLPTVSGTFFLDTPNSGEVTNKFPPEQFKVYKGGVGADGFLYQVIDKKGMKYSFKDVEYGRLNKTTPTGGYAYNKNYISSWLLSKVEDIKGNTVDYSYGQTYASIKTGESHSQSYSYTINAQEDYSASFDEWKKSQSSSTSFANKPSEIVFKNGRVRFIMSSNAQYEGVDGAAGKFLEKIIVEKGNAIDGYQELKTIHFQYSITGEATYESSTATNKYRFKLDRVFEIYRTSEEKEIASFEYSPIQLPISNSYSIDYFGMYNGKLNTNLIPKRTIFYNNSQTSSQIREIGLADRSIDEEKMKAGMLHKITYPTKGYTEFEYEPNSFYGKNLFLKDEYVSKSLDLIGIGNGWENPDDPCPGDCGAQTKTLNMSVSENTTLTITGSMVCNDCSPINSKYSYAKVYVLNNGQLQYSFTGYTNNLNKSLVISPGDASVNIEVYGNVVEAHLQVSYFQTVGDLPDENVKGFGLRVKKITNYNDDNQIATQKEYTYSIPNTNNSSGKLINNDSKYDRYSKFKYFSFTNCYIGSVNGKESTPANYSTTDTHTYSSSSKSGFENNSISYEYVTETEKDKFGEVNGKTIYQYTVVPDVIVDTKVQTIRLSNNNKRGQLLKKEVFNKANKLLLKEENWYSDNSLVYNSRNDFKAFRYADSNINTDAEYLCVNPDFTLRNSIELVSSTLKAYWHKKDKSVITNYFYNEGGTLTGELTTSTNYIYSPDNFEVKEITTTNSQGEVLKTETQYAHDVNDTRLINENRIAAPISVETTKEVNTSITKLAKQNTIYKDFEGIYLPEKIQTLKGAPSTTNVLEDRVVYHSYDAKGNPTEVSKADGTHIVYIWGYNQTQPIAKIENATLSDIPNTYIDPIKNASNLDDDRTIDTRDINGNVINYAGNEGQLRFYLNKLHQLTALNDSQITFYTYDPLIGVTSITDPRGQTVYYEYDEFNRLEFIKDADGNLLKEHKYNYKN